MLFQVSADDAIRRLQVFRSVEVRKLDLPFDRQQSGLHRRQVQWNARARRRPDASNRLRLASPSRLGPHADGQYGARQRTFVDQDQPLPKGERAHAFLARAEIDVGKVLDPFDEEPRPFAIHPHEPEVSGNSHRCGRTRKADSRQKGLCLLGERFEHVGLRWREGPAEANNRRPGGDQSQTVYSSSSNCRSRRSASKVGGGSCSATRTEFSSVTSVRAVACPRKTARPFLWAMISRRVRPRGASGQRPIRSWKSKNIGTTCRMYFQ